MTEDSLSTEDLPERSREILDDLVPRLAGVEGVVAVVLGGSWARGRARPDSDLDFGIYYDEANPLDVAGIRAVAREVSPERADSVTGLWEWGPWVNGGAWLTIGGTPVDLLYRSLDHQRTTIEAAERGEYELHFGQQPPFGFFSPTLLGELAIAEVLEDPRDALGPLKARVSRYPEALRSRVVEDFLWSAEFSLEAFARKAAARGDVYLAASTLARVGHALGLALFALNRTYLLNDKTALAEIDAFEARPDAFRARVEGVLAAPGGDAAALERSVDAFQALFAECASLAGPLYTPRFRLRER